MGEWLRMNNSNCIHITYDSAKHELSKYISTKNINIENISLIRLWRKIRHDLPTLPNNPQFAFHEWMGWDNWFSVPEIKAKDEVESNVEAQLFATAPDKNLLTNEKHAIYIAEKSIHDIRWNVQLKKLWVYYETSGILIIANKYDKKLQIWTGEMRSQRKHGALSDEKIKCLDAIHFDWSPQIASFEERHKELIKFKKKYGHVDISIRSRTYPRLGQWVREQRIYYKQKVLSANKINKLNEIGFTWEFTDNYYRYLTEKERSRKSSFK